MTPVVVEVTEDPNRLRLVCGPIEVLVASAGTYTTVYRQVGVGERSHKINSNFVVALPTIIGYLQQAESEFIKAEQTAWDAMRPPTDVADTNTEPF